MKIYTRTGDQGETGLFGGPRVSKDHVRIWAYGDVDELNAALGIVRAWTPPPDLDAVLCAIQHELFALGAELATPDPVAQQTRWLNATHIRRLEDTIDRFEATLPPLRQFILPAGCHVATALQYARCVCRRAERRLVALCEKDSSVSSLLVGYLNRLGDLLFVLARVANARRQVEEEPWRKPAAGT